MIKIIKVGDVHARYDVPKSRLDSYPDTVLAKLEHVFALARGTESYVVFVGDIGNSPSLHKGDGYIFFLRLMHLFKKYDDVKKFIVVGNHDVYGQNVETFDKSYLKAFEVMGLIERLRMDKPVILEDDDTRVAITGCDYFHQIDKGDLSYYTGFTKTNDAVMIHAVHGFLTDNKAKWDKIKTTSIDEISDTPAHITLAGHEHSGFGIVSKNNRYFVNIGSLLRVSASVGDIGNEVSVAMIEIDGKDIDIREHFLPATIAKPATMVINRAALEEEKERAALIENLSNASAALFDVGDLEAGITLIDDLIKYSETLNIPKKVVDIMLECIEEAEKEREQ